MRFLSGYLLLLLPFWIVGCAAEGASASSSSQQQPNIVFLVVESTDGRTWQRGYQDDVIPLPNLRKLEDKGATSFYRHYCNSPVCCPSRASFWSGKHPHKIPHNQSHATASDDDEEENYPVNGVWNNFEGLPENYSKTMFDVLQANGYTTRLSGKEDFVTGGHSLSVRMNAWTMYADFPYNLTRYEPWAEETAVCRENGTITPTDPITPQESSSHKGDWKDLNETLDWIRQYHHQRNHDDSTETTTTTTTTEKPFFVYQGMNIVHPPYHTSQYWLNKIDNSKIQVPEWPESLHDLHPCDVHMSMIKGCLPISAEDVAHTKSIERRREIRRIYYAMIAEFDAMVGRYMDTIDELGLTANTVFVVTSDHGDMQMEHAQFYKMSPYDASSSVPLIIYDPRRIFPQEEEPKKNRVINDIPTQHIDLFPTMLELAGVSPESDSIPDDLDGYSLVPFLDDHQSLKDKARIISTNTAASSSSRNLRVVDADGKDSTKKIEGERPPFVVVQYHGDDSPMSWFVIVQSFPCMEKMNHHHHHERQDSTAGSSSSSASASSDCMYKLVIWGTGQQVDSQLFDLTNDSHEGVNLIHDADYELIVGALHSNLQSVVEYPAVALDVAKYNRDSFLRWKDQNPSNWTEILNSTGVHWHQSWERNSKQAMAAIDEWLASKDPAPIQGCRREMAWPPNEKESDE